MKKIITVMLLCLVFVAPVYAEGIDLAGLSFAQLVELKDQINLAIWNSNEWQEVEVPQGVWVVGEDIPAGKWTIRAVDGFGTYVKWGDKLEGSGMDLSYEGKLYEYARIYSASSRYYDASEKTEITWELGVGEFIIIEDGNAVFTPYAGKPSLGFK